MSPTSFETPACGELPRMSGGRPVWPKFWRIAACDNGAAVATTVVCSRCDEEKPALRRRSDGRSDGAADPRGRVRGVLGRVAAGFTAGDQPLRPRAGEPGAPGAVEGGDAGVLRARRGRGGALARRFRAVPRFVADVPPTSTTPSRREESFVIN